MSDKNDIENKEPNEYNINEFNNNIFYINDKQNLKLDFNFDILNDPLPDFLNNKKNKFYFLNAKNFTYKRKYNEIKNEDNSFPGNPSLKLK